MESCLAGRSVPADVPVSWRARPRGGREPESPERPMLGLDQVAQLGTGEGGVAEVVVRGDQRAPTSRRRRGLDWHQFDRTEFTKSRRDPERQLADGLHARGDGTVAVPVARRRQDDQSVCGHAQQRDACRHVLEPPVVPAPIERFAQRVGNRAAGRQLGGERGHEIEFCVGEVATAVAHAHGPGSRGASRQSARSSSLATQGRKCSSARPSGARPPAPAQASR